MSGYEVRLVDKSDINNIVVIHNASFQGFFLTNLGGEFLYVYYNAFRKSKRGIVLGCYKNSKLVGFCAATEISVGFNSALIIDNFFPFLLQAFKLILVNPKSVVRLFRNMKKSSSSVKDKGLYSELFSIAVLPTEQNTGVGKLLLNRLEIELKLRGCGELTLTTDSLNNEQTLIFYRKMDYHIMYEFVAYPQRKMYRLKKVL